AETDDTDFLDKRSAVDAMVQLAMIPGSGRHLSEAKSYADGLLTVHEPTPYERLALTRLGEMAADPSLVPGRGWPFVVEIDAHTWLATKNVQLAAANLHLSLVAAERIAKTDPDPKALLELAARDRELLQRIRASAAPAKASPPVAPATSAVTDSANQVLL